jgi:hypothetical protein
LNNFLLSKYYATTKRMGKAGYTTNASYAARAAQIRSNRIVYQASPASPATTLRVSRQEKGGQMQHYIIATTFEELVKEASSPRATTFPEMMEAARASRAAEWAASPNAIAMAEAERQAADFAAYQIKHAEEQAAQKARDRAAIHKDGYNARGHLTRQDRF